MIDASTLSTIALMASVTYLTRILGYVALRNRSLGGRARSVLEAAPGCVLVSLIAPSFVSDRPADLMALAITVVCASRLPILPTVFIGIASAAALRHLMP